MKGRLILFVMCLSVLCGCSAEKPSETAQQDITTLQWFVNFSWFTPGWGENHVTQEITEKTGVRVEFSTAIGDESETIEGVLAQEKLPDLITLGWWLPQVGTLIEQQRVYPLNELADQYEPQFYQAANQQRLDWYRQEDGNVYCYPSASLSPQAYEQGKVTPSNQTFLVRKDLYEALGCPDMTTPEGFASTLRLAKETFPEVDGYPLLTMGCGEFNQNGGASLGEHLRDFLAIPKEKNGKVVDWRSDPDYLAWLKTFRQLIDEGTISPDFLLDKRQQVSEKLLRGQYFCLIYQWPDMEAEQRQIYVQDPERIYMAVDGPKNSAGDDHTLSGVGMNGWTVTFISRDCENPQAAIELLTFLMSEEGQMLTAFGLEGEDYRWDGEFPVYTEKAQQMLYSDYSAFVSTIGADNIYWMMLDNEMQSQWKKGQDPALEQIMSWAVPYTVDVSPYEVVFDPGSQAGIIQERTNLLWGKTLPRLLTAQTDGEFDRIFREYLAQREDLGWDVLVEEMSRQYRINQDKLTSLLATEGESS